MIQLLSPLAYRVMPWKNEGGSTTEIHVHPEGAGWDDFLWRVGIAEIRQSGPFSSFPGVDRSIMLLECPPESGMMLTIDGHDVELPQQEFVDFPGEAQALGLHWGEGIRDFNVMSRRGAIRHRRGWKSMSANEWFRLGGTDSRFVHVAAGQLEFGGEDATRTVAAGESLLVSGEDAVALKGGPEGAKIVWAVFSSAA